MKKITLIPLSLAVSSAFLLGACGSPQAPADEQENATGQEESAQPTSTDDDSDQDDSPEGPAGPKELGAAVKTAQGEAKGSPISADRGDDGNWEIDLLDGRKETTVKVSADGTKAQGTTQDAQDDDAGDENPSDAKVGLVEAAEAAVSDNPGTIEDVSLDNDDKTLAWEVSVGQQDGSDIDVRVDAANGKVTRSAD